MRGAAAVLMFVCAAVPVDAQERGGRYGDRSRGVPPGHLPPPGECRVWYDDRPAGQQPPPTSCREAERAAARDPYARVIYGGPRDGRDRDDVWRDRDDPRRDRPRAIPRRSPSEYPYPDSYPDGRRNYPRRYPDERGRYEYADVPFENGHRDGYEKGLEDAEDGDRYDPARHGRYRSADRGYDRKYGTKEGYRELYREGFRAGYDDGYREAGRYGRRTRDGGFRLPWPF